MTTISQMKAATEIKDKDVTVIVQDGNNRKASFELFFSRLKQFTTGNIPRGWLKYLDEYNPLQTSKRFFTDSKDELFAMFNGGFNTPKYTPVQSPYYSITSFTLYTKSSQAGIKTPFKKIDGNKYALPITNIDTISPDVAILPPKFMLTEAMERNWWKFQYMGDQTLHAVITGSFKLLVKVSKDANEYSGADPSIWLGLAGTPMPDYERRDMVVLAIAGETIAGKLRKLNARHLQGDTGDLTPKYDVVYAAVKDTPDLGIGLVQGKINAFDNTEELDLANIATQRTTEWIPTNGSTAFIMKTNKKTVVGRVQWKDEFGQVYYDDKISSNPRDPDAIYYTHPNAVAFRVWVSSPESPVESVKVWKVPSKYDVFDGLWTEYDFHVNTLVAIDPKVDYHLQLRVFGGEKLAMDSNGFMIESGGLSLLTNSRDEIQKTFEMMLEE